MYSHRIMKPAILVKRAELEHINIEVDALHYVADHISSNIRELEGALRQIYTATSETR